MKIELVVKPHSVISGQTVVELWHAGKFIGTVVGADGPGVRNVTAIQGGGLRAIVGSRMRVRFANTLD